MTFTGTLLALDLATTTGWACGAPGQPPRFGHIRFGKKGDPHGKTYRAFRRWLDETWNVRDAQPDMIVYESPAVPSFMGGKTNIDTTRLLMGFAEILEEWCWDNFELHQVTTSKVRTHFLGSNPRSNVAKPRVFERCHELGWLCETTDESDALALWDYQVCALVPELAFRTTRLFRASQ